MKISLKKLTQSGFTHFEFLIIIGVTVAIAGVGTFVYAKVHKSHASGSQYTYIGSAIAKTNPIDFYACKQLNPGNQTYTFNFRANNFSSKISPAVTYSEMAMMQNNVGWQTVASQTSRTWTANNVSSMPVSQYVSGVGNKNNPSYVSNVSYASYGLMRYTTQTAKMIVSLNDRVKITLAVNGEIYIPQSIFNPNESPSYVTASYLSNCIN
jgi:hypothetical protein